MKIGKRTMKKVVAGLTETEKACRDLVAAISVVKEKGVLVDKGEFTLFLEESRRLQSVLEQAAAEQDNEDEEEEEEKEAPVGFVK